VVITPLARNSLALRFQRSSPSLPVSEGSRLPLLAEAMDLFVLRKTEFPTCHGTSLPINSCFFLSHRLVSPSWSHHLRPNGAGSNPTTGRYVVPGKYYHIDSIRSTLADTIVRKFRQLSHSRLHTLLTCLSHRKRGCHHLQIILSDMLERFFLTMGIPNADPHWLLFSTFLYSI
jgi:hypothetical protein